MKGKGLAGEHIPVDRLSQSRAANSNNALIVGKFGIGCANPKWKNMPPI